MKANFEIYDLKVRPYGPTSELVTQFPGLDLFEDNKHFILYGKTTHIAATMCIANLDFGAPEASGQTIALTAGVYVYDENEEAVPLFTQDFTVRLAPWNQYEHPRVDIPIDREKIQLKDNYYVIIRRKGSKKELAYHQAVFFRPDILPSNMYFLKHAYFGTDDHPFRGISFNAMDIYDTPAWAYGRLTFNVVSMHQQTFRYPELTLKVHHDDGTTSSVVGEVCSDFMETDEIEVSNIPLEPEFRIVFDLQDLFKYSGINYGEIQLFGITIGGILFSLGNDAEEGMFEYDELDIIEDYTVEKGRERMAHLLESQDKGLQAARDQLQRMTGLETVKTKIRTYESLARFYRLRQQAGLSTSMPPMHSMFFGAPGTGKTTVAKIIGKLLHNAGVLSKGHVVVRERSTLLGIYYSSEAENTLKALEEAQGGILFIDEAYQLFQPHDPKDPGKFVLEALLTALADESRRDWMLILAGYTEPMKRLFDLNPGLSSRIPSTNHYYFEDYTPEQLYDIAQNYIESNKYRLTEEADAAMRAVLKNDYDNRKDDFGNARHVINMIQTSILPAMSMRLLDCPSPTTEQLMTIEVSDVPKPQLGSAIRTRQRVGFAV